VRRWSSWGGAFKILVQQVVKCMRGAGPVQDLSRAIVEHCLHLLDLHARHLRVPCPLGKELPQQAIRVFVGSTPPGRVRVGKKTRILVPLVKRRCSRIVGSSGYRFGKPCAICSGDQRCASRCKTAVRRRAWTRASEACAAGEPSAEPLDGRAPLDRDPVTPDGA
jgi:hypothetical protein